MKKSRLVALVLALTLVLGLTGSLGYEKALAGSATDISDVNAKVAKDKKYYKGSFFMISKQYYDTVLPLIEGYMKNLEGYRSAAYAEGYKYSSEKKITSFINGYLDCIQTAKNTLERFIAREFPVNISGTRNDAKSLLKLISDLPDGTSCTKAYYNGKADKEKDVNSYIDSLPVGNYITDGSIDFYSLFTSYKLAEKFAEAFKEVPLGSHYTGKKYFPLYNSNGTVKAARQYSSSECFAYSSYLYSYIFRAEHLGRDKNSDIVLKNVAINANTVSKKAFDKAGVKPGASIRVTNSSGGHSLTYLGGTSSKVVFSDCNSSQVSGYCTVRICVTDWASFRKYISYNGRKIYTVCVKKNYDSYVENL